MESGGAAPDTKAILYSYWRSSCSWRVRLALLLKGVDFEYKGVHLVKDGGHQNQEEYKKLNPAQRVPALIIDGHTLSESMAICEYLEETRPTEASLFPKDPYEKYLVRQIAETINSAIQPL